MFKEDEDWNAGEETQRLSENVLKNTPVKNNTNVKVVGKKSLLRTLQTLGSVPLPEWERTTTLHDSDSETETTPSHGKRKKKRRSKRKHKVKSEEQQENKDVNQTATGDKLVLKEMKQKETISTNLKKIPVKRKKEKHITQDANPSTNKPQGAEKMTRQQWKNKMKNKRKCNNKYRQKDPEESVKKAASPDKQEPKMDSQNKDESKILKQIHRKTEREQKAVKRKSTDKECPSAKRPQQKTENKNKIQTRKADRSSSDSSAVEIKQIQAEVTKKQQEVSPKIQKAELSKEQILKRQKLRKILLCRETEQPTKPAEHTDEAAAPEKSEVKPSGAGSFRARMEQRLESARFRYINEVLYSTTSGEAKRMFQQDPQAFGIYHKGYTAQVQKWPANPVDQIISYIQNKPASMVVADFGCGDCKIARSVKNKVHSFDLQATCEQVTVCDMANVPLGDNSVDIAVFCLSLMGTNLADFLTEANRVLKPGGVVKIAEVASRFDNVRSFISALASLGFKMVTKETENSHFFSFEFKKVGNAPKNVKKYGLQLKPCLYKKR